MAEPTYLGYQYRGSVQPVDYNDLFGKLSESVRTVYESREAQKAALDNMATELVSSVDDYELGKNQDMNQFILNGADSIRNNIYQWSKQLKSGQIKPAEYKKLMEATKTHWGMLAKSASTFDQRMDETLNRMGEGLSSGYEVYMNEEYAKISDLSNSMVYHDNATGGVYLARFDEFGNMVDRRNVKELNMPGNMIDTKINLTELVTDRMGKVPEFSKWEDLGRGGWKKVEAMSTQPWYQNWMNKTVAALTSNDRMATSVLVDNSDGDYFFYKDQNEYNEKMNSAINEFKKAYKNTGKEASEEELNEFIKHQERQMILVQRSASTGYEPVLTEDQRKDAEERVRLEVESRLGRTESGGSQQSWNSYYGKKSGGDDNAISGNQENKRSRLMGAWTASGVDKETRANMISSVLLPGYSVQFDTKGENLRIFINGAPTQEMISWSKGNAGMLAKYMYKSGTIDGIERTPQDQWELEGGKGASNKPKAY